MNDKKIEELFGDKIAKTIKDKKKSKTEEENDIETVKQNASELAKLPKERQTDAVKFAAIMREADYIKKMIVVDITPEMSRIAVEQRPELIADVPDAHKTELMCRLALYQDATFLVHLPAAFSENLEFLVDVVKQRPDLFDALEAKIIELTK